MRGSFKIAEVAGISINIHITFLLLVLLFGKYFFLAVALFFFVTLHELAHSLVAKRFGVNVKEITLLPIGGVASMQKMPDKPYQEFLISLAGPMTNILVVVVFYLPMRTYLGPDLFYATYRSFITGMMPLSNTKMWVAYIYWMNLLLAAFNLIPAFPMDGGRILRSLLVLKFGLQRATKIAVNFGVIFAILFGYFGFVSGSFLTIIIAVFIFMAASSEELQVDVVETLKKFKIKDIVSKNFISVKESTTFQQLLEFMLNGRQEDFPVTDDFSGKSVGFITRNDIINGVREFGVHGTVAKVSKKDLPVLDEDMLLHEAQSLMSSSESRALPVLKDGEVIGIVTIDDINRVYSVMSKRA